jgi:hypothetical protein
MRRPRTSALQRYLAFLAYSVCQLGVRSEDFVVEHPALAQYGAPVRVTGTAGGHALISWYGMSDTYYGEVNDRLEMHGYGVRTYATEHIFAGHFTNGKRDGDIVFTRPNGMKEYQNWPDGAALETQQAAYDPNNSTHTEGERKAHKAMVRSCYALSPMAGR